MARKRRGRGEGGVYQRESDDRWVGSVSLGYGADGKRRRRTVYGATKQEVLAKLDAVRRDARDGVSIAPAKGTVGQFLDFWLENDVRPNRAPATYKSYADTARLHIRPRVGGVRLAEFGPEHVVGLYAALSRAGVGDRTRELVHSVLRRAMRKAQEWGRVRANPVLGAERPKVRKKPRAGIAPGQAWALVAAAGHRLEALFVLAVTSGLRQGELFALEWRDVDLPAKRLRVRHSLEELNGRLRLKEPKSEKSRREVERPASAVEALAEHRKRMLAEGHYRPDAPVFPDTDGGWLRKSNFLRWVYDPIRTKAGLRLEADLRAELAGGCTTRSARRRGWPASRSTGGGTSTPATRSNSGRTRGPCRSGWATPT